MSSGVSRCAATEPSVGIPSRRNRSMARLRAVVVIQPPGFGGTPRSGHWAAAMAKASATASSARSMSPRMRMRVAVQRPASRRKISSSVSGTFGGADLDGLLARRARLGRPLEGGVEVGGVDDPEATHLLLGLGVGAVGHRDVAAVGADDRRGRRGAQTAGEHPRALLLQLGVDGVDLADDALHLVAV